MFVEGCWKLGSDDGGEDGYSIVQLGICHAADAMFNGVRKITKFCLCALLKMRVINNGRDMVLMDSSFLVIPLLESFNDVLVLVGSSDRTRQEWCCFWIFDCLSEIGEALMVIQRGIVVDGSLKAFPKDLLLHNVSMDLWRH